MFCYLKEIRYPFNSTLFECFFCVCVRTKGKGDIIFGDMDRITYQFFHICSIQKTKDNAFYLECKQSKRHRIDIWPSAYACQLCQIELLFKTF